LWQSIPPTNALCIQLPKYHDNEGLILHVRQLIEICVTNGKNIDDHKLQYFPNSLRGRYEIFLPVVTWVEVQHAFITWFSEVRTEGQASAILWYVIQKKYELVEDY